MTDDKMMKDFCTIAKSAGFSQGEIDDYLLVRLQTAKLFNLRLSDLLHPDAASMFEDFCEWHRPAPDGGPK